MDETTFWQMIERAKADSGGNGEEQVNLLVERLAQLEVSEIVDFDFYFHKYRSEAFRRDLWEAGIIAAGCLGEDSFTDFLAWLIAQGQEIYEQVLSVPDWLAEVDVVIRSDQWAEKYADVQLEVMNYTAMYAYERKTGSWDDMPDNGIEWHDAIGERTPKAELPLKYPRLWAKFGNDCF
jgi:hypothetical protein